MSKRSAHRPGSGLSARVSKYSKGGTSRSKNSKPGKSLTHRVLAYEAKDRRRDVKAKRREIEFHERYHRVTKNQHPAVRKARSIAEQYQEWRGLRGKEARKYKSRRDSLRRP